MGKRRGFPDAPGGVHSAAEAALPGQCHDAPPEAPMGITTSQLDYLLKGQGEALPPPPPPRSPPNFRAGKPTTATAEQAKNDLHFHSTMRTYPAVMSCPDAKDLAAHRNFRSVSSSSTARQRCAMRDAMMMRAPSSDASNRLSGFSTPRSSSSGARFSDFVAPVGYAPSSKEPWMADLAKKMPGTMMQAGGHDVLWSDGLGLSNSATSGYLERGGHDSKVFGGGPPLEQQWAGALPTDRAASQVSGASHSSKTRWADVGPTDRAASEVSSALSRRWQNSSRGSRAGSQAGSQAARSNVATGPSSNRVHFAPSRAASEFHHVRDDSPMISTLAAIAENNLNSTIVPMMSARRTSTPRY